MQDMPRPRPLYVQRLVNRHGNVVWYYHRRPGKRIKLPGGPGHPEFTEAYQRASNAQDAAIPAGAGRKAASGTLQWLFELYLASAHFASLAPATRAARRRILNRIAAENGQAPLHAITRESIVLGRERRAHAIEAANSFVKTMRAVFGWALDAGVIAVNPAADVKMLRVRTEGHHVWTREEIFRFLKHWPQGSKPRLAFMLMMFLGLRTCDVVRIGPQHIRNGRFDLATTQKTGVAIKVDVMATLKAELAAAPAAGLVFLATEWGKPFSVKGFGQWFVRQCRAAGVPGTAHGVRKAASTLAADGAASEKDLQGLFGWTNPRQSATYTLKASRERAATRAALAIESELLQNGYALTLPQGKSIRRKTKEKSNT